MPNKKIAELLEDADAGKDPVIPGAAKQNFSSIFALRPVLTREELMRATGIAPQLLAEAMSVGLLPRAEVFSTETVAQVTAIVRLREQGVTPRHLQALRAAAERDAELIARAAMSRTGKAAGPANQETEMQLAELFDTVRAGVLRQALQRQAR
ncbi:MAG: hypothetical protein Q4C71_04850 [Microbacteriaceae bacterium]|nr:hypothetical protein [Microbacteriaceae bacterium]